MRKLSWAALAAVGVVSFASPAGAASIVDQSSLPGDGATITSFSAPAFNLPGQPNGFGQGFTVGQTGRLDAISFGLVNRNATPRVMKLSLFIGTPTSMNAPLLYQGDFLAQPFLPAPNAFTAWSSLPTIDLRAANLQVHAGYRLMFAVTSAFTQSELGLMDAVNGGAFLYDRGAKYSLINGRFGAFGGGDFAFRTFVTIPDAAVPEPGAWMLMIGGFAIAGAGLRRGRTDLDRSQG